MTDTETNFSLVRFDGVSAKIGGTTILRDIDWRIDRGEHWGVVGTNGSGKTTLLRLVAGELWPAPDGGRRTYAFEGRVHRDAVAARQKIALVGPELQNRYVRMDWNFSALDVVLTGLWRSEIPRRTALATERRLARRILADFALEHLHRRPFLELSRGEQRRVLIARAIACGPELLILDEPASGLDSAARATLDETIERAAQHASIVASAHAEDRLPRIVTNRVLLQDSRIALRTGPSPFDTATTSARLELQSVRRDPSSAALVAIRSADIWLSGKHVLKQLDWRLEPGQHWLIEGGNGAGKSTFLRLLHGQLRPALGGSITWPALSTSRNVWALRRTIGWVAPELQAAYRYPTTAEQCIASGFRSSIGLTQRPTDREQARIEDLLAAFDLSALRRRRLSELSYGQFRRALIARTLANEPRLLLLDEPWEGLDPQSVALVAHQLQLAARCGTQIVCVSHNGDGSLAFTHRLVLASGSIVWQGPYGRGTGSASPAGAAATADQGFPDR